MLSHVRIADTVCSGWVFYESKFKDAIEPVWNHSEYFNYWNVGFICISGCEYGEDVREIWIREFVNWCRAFDQYQSQYNTWLCL